MDVCLFVCMHMYAVVVHIEQATYIYIDTWVYMHNIFNYVYVCVCMCVYIYVYLVVCACVRTYEEHTFTHHSAAHVGAVFT